MAASAEKEDRDSFIPIRHGELIRLLARELQLDGAEQADFDRFCQKLVTLFHIEHLAALIQLEDLYAPLDPDSEAIALDAEPRLTTDQGVEMILDRLAGLLSAAHYEPLSQSDLEVAIEVGGAWNVRLDVDLGVFDRLLVYARGYRKIKLKRRRWWRLYAEETSDFPEFQRLVIAFRLKPSKRLDPTLRTDVVYLKVFKNIPESELEVLLPGTKVKFSLFDRGKILLPTLTGAALFVYKLVTGALLLTLLTVVALWQWFILIAVLAGYLIRSFFSYARTRDKYQLGLTRNLYLKNLDNNSGVIYRVFNEAEEQEMCETLLGYAAFWMTPHRTGLAESDLTERVESFLRRALSREIRFDLHDALGKLVRLGLADLNSNGEWSATPLTQATSGLERNWERRFDGGTGLWKIDRLFRQN